MAANPRPSPLCIRLTERERERLQTAATKAGRTLAGEIKWRCFKKCKEQGTEPLEAELASLRAQLRAAGLLSAS